MAGPFMFVWTLSMLLGGIALVVGGAIRLARSGPVPRLRRGGAIASVLMGILFVSAPPLYRTVSAPSGDRIPSGHTGF